jgi:predicted nucleic acid-binding protein
MALDLPSGSRCFVDANILYYAFTEHPDLTAVCREFLRRVEAGDIVAHVTVGVLADALHKTMLTEVALARGVNAPASWAG